MQMQMHVIQGFWHVRHMLAHHLEQSVARAEETPALTNVLGRTKRGCKPPRALELLPPSTIQAIGLWAPRDMRDVAGVVGGHRKAKRPKHQQQRPPVDARRLP